MKPRHARAVTALAVVATTAAAVLVAGPGYEAAQVRMYSGAVWLASGRTGEATLVDGASAEVKARVPVADAGTALTVTQQGGSAVVLNQRTGGLSRVDSATEQVSPPVTVLPGSDGLVVLPSPDGLYTVDVHSGLVVAVDAAALTPRGEREKLADGIEQGNVVVDGRGRLWAIDDTTGDLVWLDRGERRSRATAARNGRLTITNGEPALADPEHGTAELLDPETGNVARSVRMDPRTGGTVAVSGSGDRSRLLIATRGELVTCSFDAGCAEPVRIGPADAELGAPVEIGDHAVVPDYTTGQATIVDIAGSRVIAQRQLFDQPTRFELITHDGIVFFNDPSGNTAGVLNLSGDVRTITKYTENPAGDKISPTPDQPAPAEQVTKVDHGKQKQKVGLELPGLADRPSPVDPAPNPVASIVVKPGHRGVVGDEFELSLTLAPGGDATTRWSFGDGTEASGTSVRHSWREKGVFTVRANATFATGGQAQAETTVTVDPPEAPPNITALTFRRPKPVIGESVHFSAETNRKPDSWEWTITQPGKSTPEVTARTAEFDHAFTTTGTYTVSLTTTTGTRTAQSSRQLTVGRGAVKGWGSNFRRLMNIPPSASSGVVAIDGAIHQALALKADGSVINWGTDIGQLNVPQEATSGVVGIAAGNGFNLALKANGAVIAWGSDYTHGRATVPEAARSGVVAIAAGASHSMALKADGSVHAWGGNGKGQATVPPAASSGVIAIGAGYETSLALKANGSIVAWGNTANGQTNVPAEATSGGVRALFAGVAFCMALKEDGSIVGWGNNITMRQIPPAMLSGAIAMDYSMMHALVLKADGTLAGWGRTNSYGEQNVPPEYRSGVLAVAAGDTYSLVVME